MEHVGTSVNKLPIDAVSVPGDRLIPVERVVCVTVPSRCHTLLTKLSGCHRIAMSKPTLMAVKFVNVAIACNVSNIQGIIGEKKTTYLPGGINYTIVLSQYFFYRILAHLH